MSIVTRVAGAVRRVDSFVKTIEEVREVGALDAMARRMDSIRNSVTGLGGSSDKGAANVVDTSQQPLTLHELRTLDRFNHYASRYISFLPEEGFRKGYRIEDESSEADPSDEVDRELHIPGKLKAMSVNARKFGGCYGLLVVDEDVPSNFKARPEEWLKQPLVPERVGALKNVVVLDPEEAQVIGFEGNIAEPGDGRSGGFRAPKFVRVQPDVGGVIEGLGHGGGVVHSSRLVYMPGAELSPRDRMRNSVAQGYDDSVLQGAWSAIANMGAFDNALATLVQELRVNVMKIEGLAALSAGDQAELLDMRQRQIAIGKALSNMILMGEGEDFAQLGQTPTGIQEIGAHLREVLSAAFGIPQTILFGDAPSGLNTDGESGRTTWAKVVSAWQTHRIDPVAMRIYEVLAASQDGPDFDGNWSLKWHPLDEPTAMERAQTEKLHAERDAIYIQWDVLRPEHVAQSRFGDEGYQADLLPLSQIKIEEEDEGGDEEAMAAAMAEIERIRGEALAGPEGTPEADEEELRADATLVVGNRARSWPSSWRIDTYTGADDPALPGDVKNRPPGEVKAFVKAFNKAFKATEGTREERDKAAFRAGYAAANEAMATE